MSKKHIGNSNLQNFINFKDLTILIQSYSEIMELKLKLLIIFRLKDIKIIIKFLKRNDLFFVSSYLIQGYVLNFALYKLDEIKRIEHIKNQVKNC